MPCGCARGWSSLPSFPGELEGGAGLWPRLSCGPIDPFDRRRRSSPALRDPDPPCRAAEGGGSSPLLTARTVPTHPPAHGPDCHRAQPWREWAHRRPSDRQQWPCSACLAYYGGVFIGPSRPHWQLFRVVIEKSGAVAATPAGVWATPALTASAPTPLSGWGGIIPQPPGRNSTGLRERPHGVAWCVPPACRVLQPAHPAP